MTEIFKDIPGYEGLYQVSNLGRVKSLSRYVYFSNGGVRLYAEKILKQIVLNGYLRINLYKNKKKKTPYIHVLVAMAFLGHKPDGFNKVINHLNENKSDNRVSNLEITTSRKNKHHSLDKSKTSSKYVGVSFDNKRKAWLSQIYINKKNTLLGIYDTEYEAHEAYKNKLQEAL